MSTEMDYRTLGTTGCLVSVLGLGNWLAYTGMQSDVDAIVAEARGAGINFFDTADTYGDGAAEAALGRALQGTRRDDFVVATKVGASVSEAPNRRGLSRKHLTDSLHASLRRLNLDYVDLYQLHDADPSTPIEETLRTLDDFVRQGKILYVGCGDFSPALLTYSSELCQAYGWERFVSCQVLINALDGPPDPSVCTWSRRTGASLLAYSPLARGILAGGLDRGAERLSARALKLGLQARARSAAARKALAYLDSIRSHRAASRPQAAIAWALRQPRVTSVLMGASRPEQVRHNMRATGIAQSLLAPETAPHAPAQSDIRITNDPRNDVDL